MNTLQFGYRGREYPVEKPSGVFRILVLGDSMVFGSGVLPQDTITAHMETILNRKFNDAFYHVLNISQNGFSAMDLESEFRDKGLQFKPDLIITILCNNDAEVSGTQIRYGEHCLKIWDRKADSWPFFYDSINKLMDAFSDIPHMTAYYGIQGDTAADIASEDISEICSSRNVPFLNLRNKVLWIPQHRQIASKADGHPSGHVHRVAAIEICRNLVNLEYLTGKNGGGKECSPDLNITGVSPEWKVEELRAWYSYRRDSYDMIDFVDTKWKPMVRDVYIQRQKRIMEYWWHDIQNKSFFDWRWYKNNFISLKKGMKILSVNIDKCSELFLDDNAFYTDVVLADKKKFKYLEVIIKDIANKDYPNPWFLDNWFENVQWVLNELFEFKASMMTLPIKKNTPLSDAMIQLESRWNSVVNRLYNGLKLIRFDEYINGFNRIPANIEENTAIEIRICLITKNVDSLSFTMIGKGAVQCSISEYSYTLGDNNPQYILFSLPLMDLFSCKFVIVKGGVFTRLEYRVNRSKWREIGLEECGYHTGNHIETPFLPAFQ